MADVKVVKPGSDLDGALFQNMASDDMLGKIKVSLDDGEARRKKFEANQKEHFAASRKDAESALSSFEGLSKNILGLATRAYQQEIDIEKNLSDLGGMVTNTAGIFGSLIGMVGKFSKGLAGVAIPDMSPLQSSLPKVGDALKYIADKTGQGLGALTKELADNYTTFRQLSTVGAGLGGNLLEVRGAAGEMRMSLSEFTKVATNESRELAGIAVGGVSESINQLRVMTQSFNEEMQGTVDSMMQMGYTNEDINTMLRRQMQLNARANFADAAVREREQKAVADLAYEMDTISRLTGIQREQIQKEIDEKRRLAEVEATVMQLDMDGSKGVGNAFREAAAQVSQFGPGALQALQEIFTQGVAHTPEAQAALTAMGSAGDELTTLALRIRQGGDQTDLGMEFVGAMMDRMNQSDFLSQVKLGPLGVEVGQKAGEFLTSGGKALYDQLYQLGDDFADADFATRYAEAVRRLEDKRAKELENVEGDVGPALTRLFNTLEDQQRDLGTSLAQQVSYNVDSMGFLAKGIDIATGALVNFGGKLSGAIRPEEATREYGYGLKQLREEMKARKEAAEQAQIEKDKAANAAKAYVEAGSFLNKESFGIELGNMLPEPEPVQVTVKSEMMDEFAKEYPKLYGMLEKVQIGNIRLLDTFENFHTSFQSFLDRMQEKIGNLKDAIIESMKTAGRLIGLALQGDFKTLVTDIGSIADNVQETTESYWQNTKNFFGDLIGSDEEDPPQPVEPKVETPPPPKIAPETISGYQNMGAQMRTEQVRQEAARAAREEIEKSQAERQNDIDFLNTTTNADVVSQLKKNDERIQELIEVSKYSAGQHMEQTGYLRQTSNKSAIGSFA